MPTDSAYPPVEIPNADLWAFLFECKDKPYPDDKAIYIDPFTSRTYTYADVKNTAIDFGKGLKAIWDWQKGDVLALFTPNCIDTPAITWGCHWAGGILSPANPGYTAEELAFQLTDSGAKVLVTQVALLPTAKKAASIAGIPHDRVIVMGDERDKEARVKHFSSIRNISGATRYRRTKLNPAEDLAFLVYSSGTTGHPKGVMLTHRNIVANTLQIIGGEGNMLKWDNGPDKSGDRILAFLPFFHIYGLTCLIHQSLRAGLTLYVLPKFSLDTFCDLIQTHRITYSYVVPPVVLSLAKHPDVSKYDLSSIRMLNSGAAPLTKDLVETLHARLNLKVKQGYGLSETSPTTHTQPWHEWDKTIGSVGRLLPNQTAKYVSETGEEVPAGHTGELWIKGPNVFKGYLNNPEMTAHALTPDGFFKTGDVGFQDENGSFYITDRVKELIKYKGFQVPPAELEGMLIAHPLVDDVAVIGIYDEARATEVPRAYVVASETTEAVGEKHSNEIAEWLATKVAAHKRLRGGVRFVEEIPKSVSGKILRRVLKARAADEEKSGKTLKAKL